MGDFYVTSRLLYSMGDFYITWGIIIYYGGFLHNMGDCYIINERFLIRMLNLLLKRFLIRMLEKPYYYK